MIRRVIATVVCGALAVLVTGCGSAPASPRSQARAIETQVWSPYCPGRLLSECTTGQAFELRSRIEQRLVDGDSPDAVLAWLRDNYGEEILARPGTDRRGLAIWVVPPLVFLIGAGIVLTAMRRWSSSDLVIPDGGSGDRRWVDEIRDEVRRGL